MTCKREVKIFLIGDAKRGPFFYYSAVPQLGVCQVLRSCLMWETLEQRERLGKRHRVAGSDLDHRSRTGPQPVSSLFGVLPVTQMPNQ